MNNWHEIDDLDRQAVPAPDGIPLGNLRHALAVHAKLPNDTVVVEATRNVYEQGSVTGLTLGDLRSLLALIDDPGLPKWLFADLTD